MKLKSCIATLLAVLTLGMTTSCEDMFDIESNRVVYDHEINSTADSVYSTLGILQCLRKVADRYVILGEVRGDMAVINEYTPTSLRNLANFNFEDENEYLNVRDYYAVINNCNYALAKMDTALAINNQRVMLDEYAALQGIRAWTYLQLAINYGEVPYYTYPVTTEADVEKAYAEGKKDIKAITEDLARHLIPYLDYDLPSFADTKGGYPVLRLVLADLYLWSGDYENAVKYLEEYFMENKKRSYTATAGTYTATQPGYFSLGGEFVPTVEIKQPEAGKLPFAAVSKELVLSDLYSAAIGEENLACIYMGNMTSQVPQLLSSVDGRHPLSPSLLWKKISKNNSVFHYETDEKRDTLYSGVGPDLRYGLYFSTETIEGDTEEEEVSVDMYTKHLGSNKINIYRRSIGYLRWAEALNALAKQRYDEAASPEQIAEASAMAMNAFYLLKDASKVFFPEGSGIQEKFSFAEQEYKEMFRGVLSRGHGDVERDSLVYMLEPERLAFELNEPIQDLDFNDTILFIDEVIIKELALESTLEGNRFGDLIRFAKRREAWGDVNYRHFLAAPVAFKEAEDISDFEDCMELYNKLSGSEEYWYLPFK